MCYSSRHNGYVCSKHDVSDTWPCRVTSKTIGGGVGLKGGGENVLQKDRRSCMLAAKSVCEKLFGALELRAFSWEEPLGDSVLLGTVGYCSLQYRMAANRQMTFLAFDISRHEQKNNHFADHMAFLNLLSWKKKNVFCKFFLWVEFTINFWFS